MYVIENSSCWEFLLSEFRIWAASSSFLGCIHPDVKFILQHVFCYQKKKKCGEHKLFRDMIYLEIFLLHLFGVLSFGAERGALRA